ncbi:hypothetical protein ACFX2I_009541 [Malus domestica]
MASVQSYLSAFFFHKLVLFDFVFFAVVGLPFHRHHCTCFRLLTQILDFEQRKRQLGYDETSGFWRVKTVTSTESTRSEVEYICRWLIVAIGENAECVVPEINGLSEFGAEDMHACEYKSGENFREKKVLVGCGNSGMEVSLDLCNIRALSSLKDLKSKKSLSFKLHGGGGTAGVPKEFRCLISGELMADPVVLATGKDENGCITMDELATVIRSLD